MCGKKAAAERGWTRIGNMKPMFEELSCGGLNDAKH
jgi:hypothetical protein